MLREIRVIAAICALLLVLAAQAAPPGQLPKGSIIAFMPDFEGGEYTNSADLQSWLDQLGWAICDGTRGTPDLRDRYLIGTVNPQDAGMPIGSWNHRHQFDELSKREQGRERHFATGTQQIQSYYPSGHRHRISAKTEFVSHLPPSQRILFIIKTH